MLDECAVRAVRKIRSPKIHDGRLLITYSSMLKVVRKRILTSLISFILKYAVGLVYTNKNLKGNKNKLIGLLRYFVQILANWLLCVGDGMQ